MLLQKPVSKWKFIAFADFYVEAGFKKLQGANVLLLC